MEDIKATRATKPTVKPTAPPTLSPLPLLFFDTFGRLAEFGGAVGVMVTVITSPVTVSSDVTGVGIHVDDGGEDDVVRGLEVVSAIGVLGDEG